MSVCKFHTWLHREKYSHEGEKIDSFKFNRATNLSTFITLLLLFLLLLLLHRSYSHTHFLSVLEYTNIDLTKSGIL